MTDLHAYLEQKHSLSLSTCDVDFSGWHGRLNNPIRNPAITTVFLGRYVRMQTNAPTYLGIVVLRLMLKESS